MVRPVITGQSQTEGRRVTDSPAFWVLAAAIFAVNTLVVVVASQGSLEFVILALVATYSALVAAGVAVRRRAG
jgi:hypothetical protein